MKYLKHISVLIIFLSSLAVIGKIFWEQELKYTQPTPIPESYSPVQVNEVLDQHISLLQKADKPRHLHFYNPDCPCSRFNVQHFVSLVRTYQEKVDFYVIIPSADQLEKVREEFDNIVPVIVDKGEELATACGVYSTPQAVIVDKSGKLYYRGNYNKARYCTNLATSYAEIALDSLLLNRPAPHLGLLSTRAYGCELGKESGFSSLINF